MEGFRDTMDYCGFSDLGYKGLPYTWDNRRECAQNVKVRLDRGLADEAWLDLFGESSGDACPDDGIRPLCGTGAYYPFRPHLFSPDQFRSEWITTRKSW
jgi:hypothetical protein